MVAPGWSLNHAKLKSLEDERDVLLIQERLLADLRASMAPLERLKRDGRGTEDLDGACACVPKEVCVCVVWYCCCCCRRFFFRALSYDRTRFSSACVSKPKLLHKTKKV